MTRGHPVLVPDLRATHRSGLLYAMFKHCVDALVEKRTDEEYNLVHREGRKNEIRLELKL